ncbi:helix-turn-helix transcriptional regulator [Streptomyces flavidovirens]
MRLAERRKFLGYSQETFAHALGVDRTTVGRWESGKNAPQPPLRPKLAEVLQVDLAELDALVAQPQTPAQESAGAPPSNDYGSGDTEEMIRREFLRAIAVTGALATLPADDTEALDDAGCRGTASDFVRMNGHLWQVYQLARSKRSMRPIVGEQLVLQL